MESTKKRGDTGELIAIKYLQKHGYRILDTNFKFGRFGEVDIIATKNGITVFIEVKYRTSTKFGLPEESITSYKLSKCLKTMEVYCKRNHIDFEKIRFDAIAVLKLFDRHRIKHYKNIEI